MAPRARQDSVPQSGLSLKTLLKCKHWLNACAAVLLVWVLSLMWRVPFICPDDTAIATDRFRFGTILKASAGIFSQTGRFYQYIYYSLTQLPYLSGSYQFVAWVRIGCDLFAFVMFWRLVSLVFGNLRLATFTLLVLCGFFETTELYNSFSAFPLWFSFGFGLFLWGSVRFKVALNQGRRVDFWTCLLIFAGVCSYENLVLFSTLFPAILIHHHAKPLVGNRRFYFKELTTQLWPIVATFAAYLAIYFFIRHSGDHYYPGTQLSLAPIREIWHTISLYSTSSLMLNLPTILELKEASIPTFLLSLTLGIGFFLFCQQKSGLPIRLSLTVLPGLVFFVFLPNLLFGFTARYRDATKVSSVYLGNYYSAFALALLIAAVISLLMDFLARRRQAFRWIGSLAIAALAGVMAIHSIHVSSRFYAHQRKLHFYWDLVDQVVADKGIWDEFKGRQIYSQQLAQLPFGRPYNYWDYYLGNLVGRPLEFLAHLPSDPDSLQMDFIFGDGDAVAAVSHRMTPTTVKLFYLSDRHSSAALVIPKVGTPGTSRENTLRVALSVPSTVITLSPEFNISAAQIIHCR